MFCLTIWTGSKDTECRICLGSQVFWFRLIMKLSEVIYSTNSGEVGPPGLCNPTDGVEFNVIHIFTSKFLVKWLVLKKYISKKMPSNLNGMDDLTHKYDMPGNE